MREQFEGVLVSIPGGSSVVRESIILPHYGDEVGGFNPWGKFGRAGVIYRLLRAGAGLCFNPWGKFGRAGAEKRKEFMGVLVSIPGGSSVVRESITPIGLHTHDKVSIPGGSSVVREFVSEFYLAFLLFQSLGEVRSCGSPKAAAV